MSHVGASLIGDPVYGRSKGITAWGAGEGYETAKSAARAFERQALHAAILGFVHPITGEELRFEAPIPDDMAGLLAALRLLPGDERG
jgi:23S rRNA pseudouridine1911/1915/1917 synthase